MNGQLKILILEDAKSDAELIQLKLREVDFDCETKVVSRGPDYKKLLKTWRPDIILSDFRLPGYNGMQALEAFNELQPDASFIFVTGTLGEEKAVETIKKGATDFVLKGNLNTLPSAIYRALRIAEERKARKEASKKLAQNEERYRSLIENTYDAILIQDEQTVISYASPAVKGMLGYEPEELTGQPVAAAIHPEDAPMGASLYEKLITGQETVVRLEERVKKKDGKYIWVHATMSDCRNVPGINGIVSNFKNIDAEKRANEQVRQSKEKLTQVTNAIPGAVYSFRLKQDGSQIIEFLSPGIENITGYKPQEYDRDLMELLPKLVHKKDAEPLLNAILLSAEKITPFNIEFRTFHKKGHPVWVKARAIPTVDTETHSIVWNGIITDISEEKEMERKLRESNERYHTLFENSPVPKIVHDLKKLRILYANQAAINFYGYSGDEMMEMNLEDLRPENEIKVLHENMRLAREEGKNSFQATHQKKNGELAEVQVNIARINYDGEEKCIAAVTDLTERNRTEKKLRFHAEILNNVTNSVIATDPEGKVIYWNKGAEQIFGYSEEEMMGSTTERLYPDGENERHSIDMDALLRGEVIQGVWKGKKKNGEAVWVNVKTTVLKDGGEQLMGFIGVSADVTSLVKAENEKTELLHDLNERMKEQSLLYKVSNLLQSGGDKPEKMLRKIVKQLPKGWQYPDQTVARILFDGEEYPCPRFIQSEWKLESQFTTFSGKSGKVQVFLTKPMPEMDEGPFLKEERALINSLAEMVQNWLEKKHAERQLKKTLEGLEHEVEERTKELREANFLLKSEVRERKWVTNQLEEEKKAMMQSIAYAQRMQKAIFPSRHVFEAYFEEACLFFLPRDGVSGDFPWLHRADNKTFFTAADCTGHGVPGALLSMVANELLNHIVEENKIHRPAKILQKLNISLNSVLKTDSETGLKDGVDLAFCSFNHENNELQYAGAYNSCYVISNGELVELKANRCSVGGNMAKNIEEDFTEHTVQLQKGDVVYVFSDGYVDQFGGPKNKKFMKKRFQNLLKENHHLPMSEQKALLKRKFEEWKGVQPQIDDILVIGVRV